MPAACVSGEAAVPIENFLFNKLQQGCDSVDMQSRAKRIKTWLLVSSTAIPVGMFYAAVLGGDYLIGASIGFFIAGGITGLEIFFIQRRVGEPLRRAPLPVYIGVTTILWLVIISIGLQLVPAFFLGFDYMARYEAGQFARDTSFALLISLVNNSIFRIRSLVGPGVFLRFLFGRYHRPKQENRIFMFLDMADSTRLAEQLGDIKVQSLISRFFFDIAQPIAQHGGETHRYIGDEVVVTWPLRSTEKNTACVRCVADINQLMAARSSWYQRKFGCVPEFRVGLHGGSVVASEVGDNKREIVYFGDTINTAARLCSACKSLHRAILISKSLYEQMSIPSNIAVEPLGALELAGKAQPLEVCSLVSSMAE